MSQPMGTEATQGNSRIKEEILLVGCENIKWMWGIDQQEIDSDRKRCHNLLAQRKVEGR